MATTTANFETKNHYQILDGLRGVAALQVVIFHCFEAFDGGDYYKLFPNHGYLAVDFFFLLSGFVVAYAYDSRWGKMTTWDFFKRRLIRLQPMVIVGSMVGAALFYFQGSSLFPLINGTPVWKMLLVMVFGFTLLPLPISADIRGWQEMHPLNGPCWSLYFEYIANILYGLIVRRFSKLLLWILVILSAAWMVYYLVTGKSGDLIGGWALNNEQQMIGLTRMMFPFFGGVLLCRLNLVKHVKYAFPICSVLLLALFLVPRLGGHERVWINGLYESFCVILMFPLIVWIGASGTIISAAGKKVCKFLGDISYPIYITHYPIIYIFTAWVVDKKVPLAQGWPWIVVVVVSAVTLAYTALKLYDEPVREWLRKKYLARTAS
ncbi:acyltransferase family protein [Mucilaginibacter ginkgonis]|uniref:Acyltransferase n=1 Tax=Mucilaginibacter ginkgonis TaxID=2682091 RepID=A0A6I4I213_9SPHI|nr:acyltransferase [Mucilaginibacter ginkgonis]QQL50813.1 acyltransferase [Mucilaginibacter ginkgonis]